MALFENTLKKLSRGSLLSLLPSQLPIPESKQRAGDSEVSRKLKTRIRDIVMGLADREVQPMISQLLHPALAILTKEQIEDGIDYLESEISKLRIDGLLRDRAYSDVSTHLSGEDVIPKS